MYHFSDSQIDKASGYIITLLTESRVSEKEITRIRLYLEETLFYYRKNFGDNACFDIKLIKSLGTARLRLIVPGSSLDINTLSTDSDDKIYDLLRSVFSIKPAWYYKRGCNLIDIPINIKRKISSAMLMIISIACAAIFGALAMLLPEQLRLQIADGICMPLFDTFMGVIQAISGPLIFITMVSAIASIGDIKMLSMIGKKTIFRYVSLMFLGGFVIGTVNYFLFGITSEKAIQMNFSDIYALILNIIPNNLIKPFIDGNTIQIIFIAVATGILMLILGTKVSAVTTLVEHINSLLQYAMKGIAIIIPIPIFLNIFSLIINGKISSLSKTVSLAVLILIFMLVFIIISLIYACAKLKTNPIKYIKKASVPFLIALTTASSAASQEESISFCENKLGIDKRLAGFGVPLGHTLYKLSKVGLYVVMGFGFASFYNIDITPTWIIMLIIISVMIALSSPPVPGATVSAILFARVGIPPEALGIAITMEVLFDFPGTAATVFAVPTVLSGLAVKLNMLDRNIIKQN